MTIVSTIKFSVSHADIISALSEFFLSTEVFFLNLLTLSIVELLIYLLYFILQAMGEEMICAVKTVNN